MTDAHDASSSSRQRIDIGAVAHEGLLHCRQGNWKTGINHLAWVAEQGVGDLDVGGLVYSYLGYGIASTQARYREGLELCKKSVQMQFYETDNYFNLARVYAMRGYATEAFGAINEGLRLNTSHRGLLELRKSLDRRRPPVLRFLPGKHPFNKALGRARHRTIRGLESLGYTIEAAAANGIRRFQRWDARATWRSIVDAVDKMRSSLPRKRG